ncbi:MAG: hypothetical protein R3A80_12120 [Bdellovibrionota bacterium]
MRILSFFLFLYPGSLFATFTSPVLPPDIYDRSLIHTEPSIEAPLERPLPGGEALKAKLQPQSTKSLSQPRPLTATDSCWYGESQHPRSFAETIDSVASDLTTQGTQAFPEGESYAKEVYGIPFDAPTHATLSDFRLCENQSAEDLKKILGKRANNVNPETLQRINQFAAQMNAIEDSKRKAGLWAQFLACLGEQETFRAKVHEDTDTYHGIPAPPGVHVGTDSDGGIKAGVFQFGVTRRGSNLFECFNSWNSKFPGANQGHCRKDFFKSKMSDVVTSTGQVQNIYCGGHKIVEALFTEKYTQDPARTPAQNVDENGKLLPPDQRCTTPFSGTTYQHFGPLRASTSNNLDQVLACLVPVIDETKDSTAEPSFTQTTKAQETPKKPESPDPVKAKNSQSLVQLAVLGFGCDNYESRLNELKSSNEKYMDQDEILNQLNAAITERCGSDKSCIKRMSSMLEPMIAEFTSQSTTSSGSIAKAHEEAQRVGYKCRY